MVVDKTLLLLLLLRRRSRKKQKHYYQNRKRLLYVKDIFRKRSQFGEFQLTKMLIENDPEYHLRYFRMSKEKFDDLLRLIESRISHRSTHVQPISPKERLAVTLRFLATGDAQQTIALSFRMGKATVNKIIPEVCSAIWEVLNPILLQPPTLDEWKKIGKDYMDSFNFPNCIGALGGKHVIIQASNNSTSECINYQGTRSIVLLAVCDTQNCFTIVDIARRSDGGIFQHSKFGQDLENDALKLPPPVNLPGIEERFPYALAGNEAFPLKSYLLRPYPTKQPLDLRKQVFNYRLNRARRPIENAFGVLTTRWQIFSRPIVASPDFVAIVVKAACCLHNYLKCSESSSIPEERQYCPPNYVDVEDEEGNVTPGQWRELALLNNGTRNVRNVGSNNYTMSAASIRDKLSCYFLTETGEIPWQYNHIAEDSASVLSDLET